MKGDFVNKPCEWGFFLMGVAALVMAVLKCVKYCDSREFDRHMRELDFFDDKLWEEELHRDSCGEEASMLE